MQPPDNHADDGEYLRNCRKKAYGAITAVGRADALNDQRRPYGDHGQGIDQAEIHQTEHQHGGREHFAQ
ncbi:hypothetical protein D3C87_1402840 [compost metagenome]